METLGEDTSLNLPVPPPQLSSTSNTFFKTPLATPGPPPGPVSPADMLQFNKPPPFVFTAPPPEIVSDQSTEVSIDPTRNPRYKTEICRNFKERARCIYGDQCQFAHGRRELRDVVRNNKYKTKVCQKFWSTGYCAYGPRCNFLHDEDKAMSEMALKEYGLTKKPEENSRRCSMGEEFKAIAHQPDFNRLDCLSPFSSNPSPVNLLEVENHGSLDYLMSSQASSRDYCFDPFLATIPSIHPNSIEAENQNFEAKKLDDEMSSNCSL